MSNFERNDPPSRPTGPAGAGAKATDESSGASAPIPGPGPSTTTAGRGSASDAERTAPASRPLGAILAALLIGLILGGLGATLYKGTTGDDFGDNIDAARYQAVILSNDKVYFGKISQANAAFYELDDAFFLREIRESETAEPQRALLPVNREIHAPENRMLIRKDEVVLVENLAKDSPILAEIRRQKG